MYIIIYYIPDIYEIKSIINAIYLGRTANLALKTGNLLLGSDKGNYTLLMLFNDQC